MRYTKTMVLLTLLLSPMFMAPTMDAVGLQPTELEQWEAEMRLITDESLAVVTIWQEARGELFEGKVAVAEVIRNRQATTTHSDGTVAGTVLKDRQFSGWNNNDPSRVRSVQLDDDDWVVRECVLAWSKAKEGSNFAKGATFYVNLQYAQPPWLAEMREVARVGNHTFYTKKKK